jgi:hypothetical protein
MTSSFGLLVSALLAAVALVAAAEAMINTPAASSSKEINPDGPFPDVETNIAIPRFCFSYLATKLSLSPHCKQ